MRSKFQVGLFEEPFVDEGAAGAVFDTPDNRALARHAATESLVLLQNRDGLLPLDAALLRRIAVVGPAADDRRLLQGDYHYPAHTEISWAMDNDLDSEKARAIAEDQYLPAEAGALAPGPHFVDHVTPLAGLVAALPGVEVVFAKGCDISGDDTSGIEAAASAASESEIALVFLGGRSGLTLACTVGEARDATNLDLTGVQQTLFDAVVATGTPTIVILLSGRVHTIAAIADTAGAVLARLGCPARRAGTQLQMC